MNSLIQPTHLSLQEVIASTLIHSLWQGAVIVFIMWFLRMIMPKNCRLNYVFSLFALIAMVLICMFTFVFFWNQNSVGYFPFAFFTQLLENPNFLKWCTNIWAAGSVIFFIRFLFSHFYLRNLIQISAPVTSNHWTEIFESLKEYYSIHKSIILLQSDKVSSAFLTGVIKPVIIIPTSWINQLTFKEAECILAHELSHVLNRDHWVNLFIQISEILFYFNPAVHILISHIKLERELKADTSACRFLKQPMLYAKLILKIEEAHSFTPALVLAFFQQKKQLKRRIESVLQIKSSRSEFTSRIALFALAFSLLFFSSISIKEQNIHFAKNEIQSTSCDQLRSNYNVQLQKALVTNTIPQKKLRKQMHHLRSIPDIPKNTEQIEQTIADKIENEVIAYEDSNESDILQQIEQEIKEQKSNYKTIIYEISKKDSNSNESLNGGTWIVPRQIRYYAPVENKTFIIIKSQNASASFDTDSDWNTPGHLKMRPIDKH